MARSKAQLAQGLIESGLVQSDANTIMVQMGIDLKSSEPAAVKQLRDDLVLQGIGEDFDTNVMQMPKNTLQDVHIEHLKKQGITIDELTKSGLVSEVAGGGYEYSSYAIMMVAREQRAGGFARGKQEN